MMSEWADEESTQGATMQEQFGEKSRVYGLWYGGASYSPGYLEKDLEVFESIQEAKEALLSRYSFGHWRGQDFNYVNQEPMCALTPGVDEGSEMQLFYGNPTDWQDPYPAQRLYLMFDHDDDAVVMVDEC